MAPIAVGADGTFTLLVNVGDFYTVTTVTTGVKGSFSETAKSVPQFPLPYADEFESYPTSQEPHYFSDQIGAWVSHAMQPRRPSEGMPRHHPPCWSAVARPLQP